MNLDYRSGTFERDLAGFDEEATYLVYCRSGNRPAAAVEVMARRGFPWLYELAGGVLAWERAGLPVE
ncbi:rhodanese-like domain-containing protein [Candidatus Bipolaricaulota bacterium]|nr:rhodanese-like domain-containing protein [Candidatus Bipolaricaulota bacterium]